MLKFKVKRHLCKDLFSVSNDLFIGKSESISKYFFGILIFSHLGLAVIVTYEKTHDKRHLVVKLETKCVNLLSISEFEFAKPLQFRNFYVKLYFKKCFVGGYPESDMKAAIHMRMCHLFSPKIQMTRGT